MFFDLIIQISEEFDFPSIVYAEAFGTVSGGYYNGTPENKYRKTFNGYLDRHFDSEIRRKTYNEHLS